MYYLMLILLAVPSIFSGSETAVVEESPGGRGTDDYLQYDSGTVAWIGGMYQMTGTWFDMEDFYSSPEDFQCEYSEWWFYHNPNMPWDTDMLVLELWTGSGQAPEVLLRADTICASHYMTQIIQYPEPIDAGCQFWLIANTCFSAYGYPSIIFDGENNFTGDPHTFVQEGMDWNPVEISGICIDAFIRAEGQAQSVLECASWAWIKGLYRE